MSILRALKIRLGSTDVGTLFENDGWVYFTFDERYALDPQRPVLSVALLAENEQQTAAQLLNPPASVRAGAGKRRLPSFFRNLLPEGALRRQLILDAGIEADDELGLLAYCGNDLPGDVRALHIELDQKMMGGLLTQGHDSYEFSSAQLPLPEAVSLSGVQPKVELIEAGDGRYVMRSKQGQDGAHFIGKLPASEYPGLPELEQVSLQLAQAAGVNTCEAQTMPLSSIADRLPFTLRDDARRFLLVRRFDRDAPTPTGRLHMEDFAQALLLQPEDKYQGDYASIGLMLEHVSASRRDDLLELLRRIKVNELLGNFDAHTKNFSLLYGTDGRPRLSPAYDIVAYAAYIDGNGHALRFLPGQPVRAALTPDTVRRLANVWALPERQMTAQLKETVHQAMCRWPEMIGDAPIAQGQKQRLLEHLEKLPDARAWLRRNQRVRS